MAGRIGKRCSNENEAVRTPKMNCGADHVAPLLFLPADFAGLPDPDPSVFMLVPDFHMDLFPPAIMTVAVMVVAIADINVDAGAGWRRWRGKPHGEGYCGGCG